MPGLRTAEICIRRRIISNSLLTARDPLRLEHGESLSHIPKYLKLMAEMVMFFYHQKKPYHFLSFVLKVRGIEEYIIQACSYGWEIAFYGHNITVQGR